jgi:Alpha-L-fucosidase
MYTSISQWWTGVIRIIVMI